MDHATYTDALSEGTRRVGQQEPPGYLDKGKTRPDPHAIPVGIPSVQGDVVEVFEQARGSGDCGTKWRYRVEGTTLALAETVKKPACDGKDWSRATVTHYGKRD